MSEERKPTAPSARNGAAPIACTTIRLPVEETKPRKANPAADSPDDLERTVIPPAPPQAR